MPDEQNFESHLVSVEEALPLLDISEAPVLRYAWAVYNSTLEIERSGD
jgi:hypothetical protein